MAKNTKKEDALSMFQNAVPMRKNRKEVIKNENDPVLEKSAAMIEKVDKIIEPKSDSVPDMKQSSVVQLKKKSNTKEITNKSRTFYMSNSIYDRLTNLAKENNCSNSEYLTFLLEQILP